MPSCQYCLPIYQPFLSYGLANYTSRLGSVGSVGARNPLVVRVTTPCIQAPSNIPIHKYIIYDSHGYVALLIQQRLMC